MRLVLAGILVSFMVMGCGFIPGSGRLFSDYHKAVSYSSRGASKFRVKADFGTPDLIEKTEDNGEMWTYNNREDGKKFIFLFQEDGTYDGAVLNAP